MKSETERLNNWVNWYEVKLNEIREAPIDSRFRMLERLYRISEKNKNCGVTITSAGVINPVNYPVYPPELKIPNYKSLDCVCRTSRRDHFATFLRRVHCLLDVDHVIKSIISGRSLELIGGEMKMLLNMLRKLRIK